jgi:aspartate-semialdehyde dehydrogenase
MAGKIVRAAIVGASSLLGKELVNELNASLTLVWDLKLLDAKLPDEAESGAQITSAGDEAILIQTIEPGAFDGMDVVFFAGAALSEDVATTKTHWKEAHAAGAVVIDVVGALEGEAGVVVAAPWVEGSEGHAGTAKVIVPAHPAAVMLSLVLTRLRAKWSAARAAATVMEPASQQGSAGLDELHKQTVALLSFQPVLKDVYDTQVAFNLEASLGAAAKVNLAAIAARIRRDVRAVAGEKISSALALQLLQAPVFNGYTASVFVEVEETISRVDVEDALRDGIVSVETDEPGPSNLTATEQGQILVGVREERDGVAGFWLWVAADNLKLAAQNAVACAVKYAGLESHSRVQ